MQMLTGKPLSSQSVNISGLIMPLSPHAMEQRAQAIQTRREQHSKRLNAIRVKPTIHAKKRAVQQLHPGDRVQIYTSRPHYQAHQLGIPVKWVYKWDQTGTIVEQIKGHPHQYLVKKDGTGNIIKRSLANLRKSTVDQTSTQSTT